MKEKTIKVKLTQKQVLNMAKNASGLNPYKRVFSIDAMSNAVSVDTNRQTRYVGDVIESDEADFLCRDENTEVQVS